MFPEGVPRQMAFANEMAVMTEFAQADVSVFQGNKELLNEAGSTSTPAGMAIWGDAQIAIMLHSGS